MANKNAAYGDAAFERQFERQSKSRIYVVGVLEAFLLFLPLAVLAPAVHFSETILMSVTLKCLCMPTASSVLVVLLSAFSFSPISEPLAQVPIKVTSWPTWSFNESVPPTSRPFL